MTGTTGKNVAVPDGRARAISIACAPRRRVPVCAGFGIRSREQVERLSGHVDGVIVGSALVEVLERGEDADGLPALAETERAVKVVPDELIKDDDKGGSHWGIAALLAALAMVSPFSIDTFFPSFPAISQEFSLTDWQIQQTITVYMLPFALMTLVQGPLSDALGRTAGGARRAAHLLARVHRVRVRAELRVAAGVSRRAGNERGRRHGRGPRDHPRPARRAAGAEADGHDHDDLQHRARHRAGARRLDPRVVRLALRVRLHGDHGRVARRC